MEKCCECGPRCRGIKKIIVGILILLNAFIWPQWLGLDGWIKFAAVLIVLLGLVELFMPNCCKCGTGCEQPVKGKKK